MVKRILFQTKHSTLLILSSLPAIERSRQGRAFHCHERIFESPQWPAGPAPSDSNCTFNKQTKVSVNRRIKVDQTKLVGNGPIESEPHFSRLWHPKSPQWPQLLFQTHAIKVKRKSLVIQNKTVVVHSLRELLHSISKSSRWSKLTIDQLIATNCSLLKLANGSKVWYSM